MRILITGASGFVGGSLLRRLGSDGAFDVHGVGRRALDLPNYTPRDLSQAFDLPFRPDVVIHAAARASPWGARAEFERHNVGATRHVIDFCRRHDVPRLIYVSSSSVFYRNEDQLDLTEESPIGPNYVNDYAATKHAAECVVMQAPLRWTILRPRAVFGPGDTVLFPRILAAARRGRLPLIERPGAPAMGDLIYIDSLCDYIAKAAADPAAHGCYNLTNAQPVPMQQFLSTALERLGLPAPRRRVSVRSAMWAARALEFGYRALRRRDEPPVTRFGVGAFAYSKTFDVRKALAAFGPPSVSIDEGLERFVHAERNA